MADETEIELWLEDLERWSDQSVHRMRLHRAFAPAKECFAGNSERLLHSYSRLGIWANKFAEDADSGALSIEEIRDQLVKIAEFGKFAFQQFSQEISYQVQFDLVLQNELIQDFCSNPARNYNSDGFRINAQIVTEADARDFLRAWKGGLLQHRGRGLYRAARSAATEQLFWDGPKSSNPRTFTLWHEPIITFAALARLHWDFGWPANLVGTQSSDWAFDLVAYRRDDDCEHIAGEVKKTNREIDALILNMKEFGANPDVPLPSGGKLRNAYKKISGLKARRAPVFWAVGPDNYSLVFQVEYGSGGVVMLHRTDDAILRF